MRYTFTIEIPDKRGSHETTMSTFKKQRPSRWRKPWTTQPAERETSHGQVERTKLVAVKRNLIEECWEAVDEVLGKSLVL